jgi:hypothetical protein
MPDQREIWGMFLFILGVIVTCMQWLGRRVVTQVDNTLEESRKDRRDLRDRILKLEGTVNSESWGLVSVVGKLNGNVEKLTSAVEHINTVMTMQKEKFGG